MRRYFNENKQPVKLGELGPYYIYCRPNTNDFNNSADPDNIIWDEIEGVDTPRFRTAVEKAEYLERRKLDSMTKLSKLQLSRALRELNLWKEKVKPLLKENEVFEDDWNNSDVIDTEDPVFLAGFAMTSIDMDEVKRKIIEMNPEPII